jgi:hypothetical protein
MRGNEARERPFRDVDHHGDQTAMLFTMVNKFGSATPSALFTMVIDIADQRPHLR